MGIATRILLADFAGGMNEIMPKVIVGVIGVFFLIFIVAFIRIFFFGDAVQRQIEEAQRQAQRQQEEARRCPQCRKGDALVIARQKELKREMVTRTVPRMEQQFNAMGQYMGQTQRHVQVQVTCVTNENLHRCKFCGHEFTAIETTELGG